MLIRDEGSRFSVPLALVWKYLDLPQEHSRAHGHTSVHRERTGAYSGRYTWRQPWGPSRVRFTMEWTSFPPLGVAYDVIEGPFKGSTFFLYYVPRGRRTEVSVVGDFVSPSLPARVLRRKVLSFFAREFRQDDRAMRERFSTPSVRSPPATAASHRTPRTPLGPRRPRGRRSSEVPSARAVKVR